ncbi:hypothetical protein O181_040528 [Austropuccinia psidii MF-1]|uniref:Uncharacterized protein n=1 Tax=Austropuccinia psidii MF-1 TaxID=1389203 RepID=A0A9Q3HCY4_9BASI|nr:hypothetical protein [Austropuccinia psidii MF-1]
MSCTLCTKRGIPCIGSSTMTNACDAFRQANKQTRTACLLCNPSDHTARGVPAQEALARIPLWSMMMKAFLSRNGCWDLKQADRNYSGQLALSPQVSISPPTIQW